MEKPCKNINSYKDYKKLLDLTPINEAVLNVMNLADSVEGLKEDMNKSEGLQDSDSLVINNEAVLFNMQTNVSQNLETFVENIREIITNLQAKAAQHRIDEYNFIRDDVEKAKEAYEKKKADATKAYKDYKKIFNQKPSDEITDADKSQKTTLRKAKEEAEQEYDEFMSDWYNPISYITP